MTTTKMVPANEVAPLSKSWAGEALDIYKETENGIPSGRTSILWRSETGNMAIHSYGPGVKVEIFCP